MLSLAAAASWGLGDFAGGISTRLSSNVLAVFVAQLVGLGAAALLLLVSAETAPPAEAQLWAAAAGVAGTFGLGCFYLALSRGSMGLVAPLTALLAAAWPATVALITGGSLEPLVLAGMGVALLAVVLISLPEPDRGRGGVPTYHGSRTREWLLVLGAAFGFGAFFLLVDASQEAGGAVWWPLFMVKLAGVATVAGAVVLATPLGRLPPLRIGAAALLVASVAGFGDLGGNLFFVLASSEGELAVVIVLTSLYPVSTAILARVFLRERLTALRLAGVALALLGVILIGLGEAA